MAYTVNRCLGKVVSITKDDTGHTFSFNPENSYYRDFLAWHEAQPVKLDLTDHEPDISLADRRKAEYEKQGVTIEAMTVALWESVVENRPEALTALQEIRNQVKVSIPKGK